MRDKTVWKINSASTITYFAIKISISYLIISPFLTSGFTKVRLRITTCAFHWLFQLLKGAFLSNTSNCNSSKNYFIVVAQNVPCLDIKRVPAPKTLSIRGEELIHSVDKSWFVNDSPSFEKNLCIGSIQDIKLNAFNIIYQPICRFQLRCLHYEQIFSMKIDSKIHSCLRRLLVVSLTILQLLCGNPIN